MTDESADEKFYKPSEVEKMLSISKSTMKRWIRDKKIRAVKFGPADRGSWRISASALAEFKKTQAHYNTEPADTEGDES